MPDEPEIRTGGGVEAVAVEVGNDIPKAEAQNPEQLLADLCALGVGLRDIIVLTKKLKRTPALDPHQDQMRSLSLAQAHLQTGFMWLRRAIIPTKEF
jgi:hypothetical protein